MDITFSSKTYPFVPWKPATGQVFASAFSFDSETTLIDDQHPWLTPAYVLGAAFDGQRGFFVPRDGRWRRSLRPTRTIQWSSTTLPLTWP